jgi:hypothetical protein
VPEHSLRFSTKGRVGVLSADIRERLWPYIGGIAKQNGMIPKCIGGLSRDRRRYYIGEWTLNTISIVSGKTEVEDHAGTQTR